MSAKAVAISIPLMPSPIQHLGIDDIKVTPRPRYKGHWALMSYNLEQSDMFYRALSGAELICMPVPGAVATSWDDEHHRFFVAKLGMLGPFHLPVNEPVPVSQRLCIGGGSVRFSSPKVLADVVVRMRAIGHLPERILDRANSISVIFRDPEGILVDALAPKAGSGEPQGEISTETFLDQYGG